MSWFVTGNKTDSHHGRFTCQTTQDTTTVREAGEREFLCIWMTNNCMSLFCDLHIPILDKNEEILYGSTKKNVAYRLQPF